MYRKQLQNIGQGIINSKSISAELAQVDFLSDFFFNLTRKASELSQQKKCVETFLPGGVALSSADAATCLDDQLRTSRFIKGIYNAIKELFKRFPDQKIHIVYAGCGPYATLLLPVLSFFSPDDIEATLIDVNLTSVQSVKELVAILDLKKYIYNILHADAVTYKHPGSHPLHMVITETMFHALIREPQVAITANLARQITNNGILIPEEIRLDLAVTLFGKEPYLQNGLLNVSEKKSHSDFKRCRLNTLFSMNKESDFSDKIADNSYRFESTFYKIPENFDTCPDICILTDIRIFKDIRLAPAESLITNPYCVASLFNMRTHTHFKLIYDFKDIPNWTYQLKG